MLKFKKLLTQFPIITFLLVLVLLFIIIFVGKKIRQQNINETTGQKVVKIVTIFDTNSDIQSPIAGEIDRADTVILRATANGIVTRTLKAGNRVYRGQEIVKLSDTYSGSSQAEAAAAVANRNAQFQKETIDTQRDILKAEKKDLKKTKDRQARITWKQHYLQERSAELSHDTAQLQAAQAYASVALFKTVAPLSGLLEEVAVNVGDDIKAGQIIAILKADNEDDVRVTAHVGAERALHIDVESKITANYKGVDIPLEIVHISQSSTSDQSYTLTFRVNKNILGNISNGSFVNISLPLKSEKDTLVPLDSIHFSSNNSEIYILENNMAHIKKVTLGEVLGSYVIVTDGLDENNQIIMDRNVTDGEHVQIEDL